MDTRTGDIYDSRELAEAAGVPDEDLVTGSREALEKLRKRLVFTKGSFKSVESLRKADAVDPGATDTGKPTTREKESNT
jgi:hypothetical protein